MSGDDLAPKDAYDALPETIKCAVDRHAWTWLSDREKADLVQHETEPEY